MGCPVVWGSHGCNLLPEDGHTVHLCTSDEYDEDGEVVATYRCTEYDEVANAVRYPEGDDWGEWMPQNVNWKEWSDA